MSSKQDRPLLLPLFAPSVASNRNWFRLDQVAEVIDCPHSTPVLVDNVSAPYVVRSQDMRSGTFMAEQAGHVSEETYQERIARAEPRFGDLLYSREGTYFGIAAEVPCSVRVCLGQRMVLIRPKAECVDHRFLRYWLNSPLVFGHIHGFRDGTVAERLNLPTIRGLAVALPEMCDQQAIGAVLGTLDDRIALLRETNATLEAIAQALFKSWFVDFDPVHAKARGEDPEGLPEDLAALFPDSFEESPLGLVPRGWRVSKIEDLMELAYGKALKSTDRIDGPVPVYGSGGVTGYHNASLVNGPSIIIGRKGTVGSLYWEDRPFFPIDTVFYVRTERPLTYCYYLLKTLGLENMNTDGAVPGLNRNNAYRLRVVIPPEDVQAAFDNIVTTLRNRIFSNTKQSQTLATLRDSLLPRLISGALRLPEEVNRCAICEETP